LPIYSWDFTPGNGTAIYNIQGKDDDGWKLENGQLYIGGNDGYANNIATQFSWFLYSPSNRWLGLRIEGVYDTEENGDFLVCGYEDRNGNFKPIHKPFSGKGQFSTSSRIYNVAPRFEFFCRFTSDDMQSGPGVIISKFEIY
jgi:hypothetical protein